VDKHVDADYLSRDIAEQFRKLKEETDKTLNAEDTVILLSAATRKEREVNLEPRGPPPEASPTFPDISRLFPTWFPIFPDVSLKFPDVSRRVGGCRDMSVTLLTTVFNFNIFAFFFQI
jgi:hypothetical protein